MEFTLETFFFDTPIYNHIDIEDIDNEDFSSLFYDFERRDFEGYNPFEKKQSTFKISGPLHFDKYSSGYGSIEIQCKRYHNEFIFYVYWNQTKKIIVKIGQYPSVADFHLSEVRQYNKLIPEEKLKEFTRAIGLAANGIGIGSFVYLRRIFEYLIYDASKKAIEDNIITEIVFQKARMDEKIDLLQRYLPDFLVENRAMYSILSIGIHELDENDCLAHFEILKNGIEIILDQKLDELRQKEKIEIGKKKIAEIKGKIKK